MELKKSNEANIEQLRLPVTLLGLLFVGSIVLASFSYTEGVQKDLRLAAHFYRLAAARQHVAAQYNLAVMTANGIGVKRDREKTFT